MAAVSRSSGERRALRVLKSICAGYQGGRSWGISSPDADYDIRFIFANDVAWYLSIDASKKDTISFQLGQELDFCGWDVKKALTLLRESNPTLLDCIRSPHVLVANLAFFSSAKLLAQQHLSVRTVANQLFQYALKHYNMYIANKQPVQLLKKYFYVLHPLLTLRSLRGLSAGAPLPTLTFRDLVVSQSPTLESEAQMACLSLLELKLTSSLTLSRAAHLLPTLDEWVLTEFEAAHAYIQSLPVHAALRVPFEPFDALLQNVLLRTAGDEAVAAVFAEEK